MISQKDTAEQVQYRISSLISFFTAPMTLVSANIRFVPIFEGVHWRDGVKRQWGNRKHGLSRLRSNVFSTLRNETNVIIIIIIIILSFI